VDTQTVTLFLALLAVLAQSVVVGAGLLWVGARLSHGIAAARDRVLDQVAPQALALAAVVALTCTVGSLWLSEGAHFPPCKLCWYQRIAMYPQVVILGVAAIRRDVGARISAWVLCGIGGSISIYHLLIERYPTLSSSSSCDPLNPCSIKWVERLGYLTIPGMALSGFALIAVLLAAAGHRPHLEEPS
jgi:disulfide bond formation protein DsbB